MRILWNDVLVGLGFLMYLGAIYMTIAAINEASGYEGMKELAVNIEANPIMREAMGIKYLSLVVSFVGLSLLATVYYLLRKKYLNFYTRDKFESAFVMFTFYIFLLFLQNFLHDLAVYKGLFA